MQFCYWQLITVVSFCYWQLTADMPRSYWQLTADMPRLYWQLTAYMPLCHWQLNPWIRVFFEKLMKLEDLLVCLQNLASDLFPKNMTKTRCPILFLEQFSRIKFFPAIYPLKWSFLQVLRLKMCVHYNLILACCMSLPISVSLIQSSSLWNLYVLSVLRAHILLNTLLRCSHEVSPLLRRVLKTKL